MSPELRYIETYEYPRDLPPEKRTPDKAKITRTAYEVSDEQLAQEKRVLREAHILDEIDEIKIKLAKIEAFLAKLGYK
jgi:hypothetical protein